MMPFYTNWFYWALILFSGQQKLDQKNRTDSDRRLMDANNGSDGERVEHFAAKALQRFVDKLSAIAANATDGELRLRSTVPTRHLNILRHYLNYEHNCLNCEQNEELEDVIGRLIGAIEVVADERRDFNYYERISLTLVLNGALIFVSVSVLIYALKYLTNNLELTTIKTYALKRKLTIISLVCLTIALLWKWRQLYLIELSRKQAMILNAPLECLDRCERVSFVSWIRSKVYSFESRRDEYCRAVNVHPFWEVNPLLAVSNLVSEFAFTPLSLFGHHFGAFMANMFAEIPFYLVIPAFLLLSFSVTLIILLVAFWLIMPEKYTLRVPFMTIEFNRSRATQTAKRMTASPLNKSDTFTVKRYQIKANVVNVYHRSGNDFKKDEIYFDSNKCYETDKLSLPFVDMTEQD